MFLEPKRVSIQRDSLSLILPGQLIAEDLQFLNGHGTFRENGIYSSICGTLKRTNKLISVKPLKTRFNGEIGDVVIGRILEISGNRWKVDIKARQDAILNLSSISLPGGIQRRKTVDDEQEMKSFFKPGDLLVAEVSQFSSEVASLQARNIKYGKLRNGVLLTIPSALVRRSKSQFSSLPCGIDVIFGLNGFIHVSKHVHISPEMINQPEGLYSDINENITVEERKTIARVSNLIRMIAHFKVEVFEELVVVCYEISLAYDSNNLLNPEVAKIVVEQGLEQLDRMQE